MSVSRWLLSPHPHQSHLGELSGVPGGKPRKVRWPPERFTLPGVHAQPPAVQQSPSRRPASVWQQQQPLLPASWSQVPYALSLNALSLQSPGGHSSRGLSSLTGLRKLLAFSVSSFSL